MALRNAMGTAARMTAGFWTEVAKATDPDHTARSASRPTASPTTEPDLPAEPETASAPEGVMVPLDTWTAVMAQLGHLHEAGQELADARERAARAETKAEFLKEQLAEERARSRRRLSTRESSPEPAATDASHHADAPDHSIDLTAGRQRIVAARERVSSFIANRR